MAQNILSAGDWVGSSVEENRGLPELRSAAKFIGGKPQASRLRIVRFTLMALCVHLLSGWRAVLRWREEKLRTIFIDYYCYALKGQKCTMVSIGPNVVSHGQIYMIT